MGRQQQQRRRTAAAVPLCWFVVVIGVLVTVTVCSASRHHGSGGWEGAGGRRRLRKGSLTGDGDDSIEVRSGGRRESFESGKHVLLHEAVRKLLGFPSASPARPGRRRQHRALLPDPRTPPPMPKYVLDLYEKYRSGEISQGHTMGNTIRSVPAEIGEVNGEAMFIFNLSSIAPTERVLRAHVHLYKRKSPSRKRRSRKRAETELVLYEVAPHYLSQTGTIIMRMSSWGWQWYGATESVLSCLLADRRHPHLFALSFRAEKPNGKTRTLALKKFVRHHSLPFLILYSNETESVNLEELDIVAERLKQREGDEQLEQPADNVQESDEDKDRSDSSEENEDHDQWDESEESDDGDQWADSEDVDDDGLVESDFGSDDDDDDSDEENDSSDSDFDENNFDAVEEIAKNIQEGGDDDVFELSETFGEKRSQRKRFRNSRKLDHHKKKRNHRKDIFADSADTEKHSTRTEGENEAPSLQSSHKRDSGQVKGKEDSPASLSSGGQQRKKRSILTNEIPEDPADYTKFHYRFNLPQTHPGMLTARRDSRHRLENSRLIPYPQGRGNSKRRRRRKHRKRKNRKRNRKNRRKVLLPEQWEDYHDNLATPDNNPSQLCSRRHLVVDFADIGWGDWIISPKSFEAHYCAGTCPFPLTKRLRPSNHATIQSIVNAIGLYSNVPAPCCVPDAMTSVTLLYFDENRNVVLKNYPGMSVQSCACR